jgi:hypothetical protein
VALIRYCERMNNAKRQFFYLRPCGVTQRVRYSATKAWIDDDVENIIYNDNRDNASPIARVRCTFMAGQ